MISAQLASKSGKHSISILLPGKISSLKDIASIFAPSDLFIMDLYSLAKKSDYGTLKDELIRDRIVTGVLDKKLSERMQLRYIASSNR